MSTTTSIRDLSAVGDFVSPAHCRGFAAPDVWNNLTLRRFASHSGKQVSWD